MNAWQVPDGSNGSEAGKVRLMHYDPRWRQEFQQTRSGILHGCLGLVDEVHHVGSTAISGITARPVVDVIAIMDIGNLLRQEAQQGVDPLSTPGMLMREAATLIQGLNFRSVESGDHCFVDLQVSAPQPLALVKPRHGSLTHAVYLCARGDDRAAGMLRIADYFRAEREAALEFDEQKTRWWRSADGDAMLYSQWKAEFFDALDRRLRDDLETT
ncbi:MAG: GrpB family protein [Planctomycetota bacterium]